MEIVIVSAILGLITLVAIIWYLETERKKIESLKSDDKARAFRIINDNEAEFKLVRPSWEPKSEHGVWRD